MNTFPSILTTYTDPQPGDRLNSPSHSGIEQAQNQGLSVLENFIGTLSSVQGTLMYDIRSVNSNGGGHVQSADKGGTGQTNYTKGDILVGQSTSVLSKLAISPTDGYALVTDSTQPVGVKWGVPNNKPTIRVYSQASTFTWSKPSILSYVVVEVVGGGGGAGHVASSPPTAGAGGGAAYGRKIIPSSLLGASENIVVGAGGVAASSGNNTGGLGGRSSFGTTSFLSAGGGGGGGTSGSGGGGGSATGDFTLSGENAPSTGSVFGTRGGNSFMGWGGVGPEIGGPSNGQGYGGGGSGPLGTGTGGNGANGVVIVTEY